MLETSTTIARQYIDAVSTFEALEEAKEKAAHMPQNCASASIIASNCHAGEWFADSEWLGRGRSVLLLAH